MWIQYSENTQAGNKQPLVAAAALALLLAIGLATPKAQAQFVCADSGGGVSGSTAPGTEAVACGINAAANGDGSVALGRMRQPRQGL